jgi:hypothetical protein
MPINITAPHFRIECVGTSWSISVHRHWPLVPQVIPAATLAEAMRLARPLSEGGLVGYLVEIRPGDAWPLPMGAV